MARPRPAAAAVALLSSLLVGLTPGLPTASALTATGRAPDAWTVYALADGRLPDPVPAGTGSRVEVHLTVAARAGVLRVLVPPTARPGARCCSRLDRVGQVASALRATDPRRLHLTGSCNGAMTAYRFACSRPGAVAAAVLAVSGP